MSKTNMEISMRIERESFQGFHLVLFGECHWDSSKTKVVLTSLSYLRRENVDEED